MKYGPQWAYECDIRRAGMRDGLEQGLEQGRADVIDQYARLGEALIDAGRSDDAVRAMTDPAYRARLLAEFGIAPEETALVS